MPVQACTLHQPVRVLVRHSINGLLMLFLQVAPAMNTFMWDSPFTEKHLGVLRSLGIRVVEPISKRLACGDVGNGALAEVDTIAKECSAAISTHSRNE